MTPYSASKPRVDLIAVMSAAGNSPRRQAGTQTKDGALDGGRTSPPAPARSVQAEGGTGGARPGLRARRTEFRGAGAAMGSSCAQP